METRLYRTIWRWHFYAGLIVAPVLLAASVTGAIYVFKSEIERVIYADMMFVKPVDSANKVSFENQINAARTAVSPESKLVGLYVSADETRATELSFRAPDKNIYYVFVNSFSGEMQGAWRYGDSFFDIVLKLHTELFAGTVGRVVVEMATSWGIVLLVTGVCLWLPRGKQKFWGVWLPRLRDRRGYVVWRDLHTVPAFYLVIFTFLILLTGLYFSFVVGQGFRAATFLSGGYPESVFDPPKSIAGENAEPISIDALVAAVRRENPNGDLSIEYPFAPDESFAVTISERDLTSPEKSVRLIVNQYTGETLARTDWQDLSLMAKAGTISYPLHIGSIYGLPTKIIAFVSCLLLIFATISGAVMWWIRRPTGKLGTPREIKDYKVSKIIVLTIIVLGVLMPTVGASLILILLADWLMRKVFSRAAR